MSDLPGKQRLLQSFAEMDRTMWAILPELAATAATDEAKLREELRPHDETGLSLRRDGTIIALRARLDTALDALTLLEIAYETGVVTESEQPVPELGSLHILFQSGAMLRYVNAYLYFAIRFLAYRLEPQSLLARQQADDPAAIALSRHVFPLVAPPSFVPNEGTDSKFARFISLPAPPDAEDALSFLDGLYHGSDETQQYELWLRGLRPELDDRWQAHFLAITTGCLNWATSRSDFYLSLQSSKVMPTPPPAEIKAPLLEESDDRPLGGWIVVDPIAARFALADAYWLARLLRADVTAGAGVTYPRTSWTRLLRFQAALRHDANAVEVLRKAEEVMRSVFDFVCDLVQNAVAVSLDEQRKEFEPHEYPDPPDQVARWRAVFDEELTEITEQRVRRSFPRTQAPVAPACVVSKGWSERLKSGSKPQNLVGLAFSGGGIRSATFNLGVLQGLQAFDQLRYVDYLSTVSGGGFIGSWLVGNVKRTQQWLGRLTSWDESIAHLRAYSNYLAPRTGVLSADPWTIAASWARNAFLVQLTGLSWLLLLLLGILIARLGFVSLAAWAKTSSTGALLPQIAAGLMGVLITVVLAYNFTLRTVDGKGALGAMKVRYLAVIPAWIGAFFITVQLWSNAAYDGWSTQFCDHATYSEILLLAWQPWKWLLLLYLIALLLTLSLSLSTSSLESRTRPIPFKDKARVALRSLGRSFWIGLLCLAVLYLGLCAVLSIFIAGRSHPDSFGSYAFVFGPALVLACFTLSITLLIGLSGRPSNEAQREWWTRFGTWVAIYAGIGLVLSAVTVLGPKLFLLLNATGPSSWRNNIKWGALASWVGTVVAGLFSGKSSKTSGDKVKSPWLEILAQLGGFVFIVGAVIGTSTILYLLLLNLGTSYDLGTPYWTVLRDIHLVPLLVTLALLIVVALLFSWYFEINIFGLNQFYRNRVVRCYLGATRWALGERNPHPFTKFDFKDDLKLSDFASEFRGPFPILNCTLNLAGSSDLALHTRHSASFSLTPFRCGSDRPKVGYASTSGAKNGFAGGVMLGQAVAISGAAASPNMGYNTSPLVAFLLTMFNVRLGWWFPNPGKKAWNHRGLRYSLYYLVNELFGMAGEKRLFVNVSDGGHFENLGIYELVRRRCKVIIACDAECDELLQFGGLGNVIRLCKTDFDATIEIDVKSIREQRDNASYAHCTVGKITYSSGSIGYLLYIKASITGDEDVSVAQYRSSHPTFPHETTADQFFSEDQFESYRRLGQHIVSHALRGAQPGDHPVVIAERLADVMAPAGCNSDVFLKHARALDKIWERFRQSPTLAPFLREITGTVHPVDTLPSDEELCLGLEMLQLMEDVFMDLRMDDFWDHPDNRGWAMLFMQWARSPRFRRIWSTTNRTFGIRFEYFCDARLGLTRDSPILRV